MKDIDTFNFVSKSVKDFIDSERTIHIRNPDEIFSDTSWLSNFFNFNLTKVIDDSIANVAKKLFDGESYNFQLARVQAVYTSISLACGTKYMNGLRDNLIDSLVSLTDRAHAKTIRNIVNKYPVLIISALGTHYFGIKQVEFRKRLSRG